MATNKNSLLDAEEYVNFVISTIRNRNGAPKGSRLVLGLGRIALRPSNYYSQFVFLDEYNFGGIRLERPEIEEDEEVNWVIPCDEGQESTPIVPTVVRSWNMIHYLGGEIAQEYFRRLLFGKVCWRNIVNQYLSDGYPCMAVKIFPRILQPKLVRNR